MAARQRTRAAFEQTARRHQAVVVQSGLASSKVTRSQETSRSDAGWRRGATRACASVVRGQHWMEHERAGLLRSVGGMLRRRRAHQWWQGSKRRSLFLATGTASGPPPLHGHREPPDSLSHIWLLYQAVEEHAVLAAVSALRVSTFLAEAGAQPPLQDLVRIRCARLDARRPLTCAGRSETRASW